MTGAGTGRAVRCSSDRAFPPACSVRLGPVTRMTESLVRSPTVPLLQSAARALAALSNAPIDTTRPSAYFRIIHSTLRKILPMILSFRDRRSGRQLPTDGRHDGPVGQVRRPSQDPDSAPLRGDDRVGEIQSGAVRRQAPDPHVRARVWSVGWSFGDSMGVGSSRLNA